MPQDYKNINVCGTEKVCIGKARCNASIPIRYMYSLNNNIHRPDRVNFRDLKENDSPASFL